MTCRLSSCIYADTSPVGLPNYRMPKSSECAYPHECCYQIKKGKKNARPD